MSQRIRKSSLRIFHVVNGRIVYDKENSKRVKKLKNPEWFMCTLCSRLFTSSVGVEEHCKMDHIESVMNEGSDEDEEEDEEEDVQTKEGSVIHLKHETDTDNTSGIGTEYGDDGDYDNSDGFSTGFQESPPSSKERYSPDITLLEPPRKKLCKTWDEGSSNTSGRSRPVRSCRLAH